MNSLLLGLRCHVRTYLRNLFIICAVALILAPSIAAVATTDSLTGARAFESQAQAEARYSDAIRSGRSAVRALTDSLNIPGMSVAVGINGEIVWSEGFGYADLENKVPVSERTRFRLGSVSKMLTVAAVAKLYEEGKLDLDAPIHQYVPTFPDKGHKITARQIAGHLSGIRHYQAKDYTNGRNIDFEHYDKVVDSLKIFQDDPLVAEPGTKYQYTTFGYTLLSAVVEGASKKSFLDYLQEAVFQPLKMEQTTADRPDQIIPDRTGFYDRDRSGQIKNAAYVDPSYKWSGGGMLSTAEDLIRFGSAHLRAGFLKPETLDLLFTSQRTSEGKETGVGIGWRIAKDSEGRRMAHHAGSMGGCRAVVLIYRDAGVVVALLSNLGATPRAIEESAQAIAGPFLKAIDTAKPSK
ncbi:MAG: beta-lactamase family protein [Blastocatellia bacterium]|nr:beta-lactamase family protein [Blastocatellia bacterium]